MASRIQTATPGSGAGVTSINIVFGSAVTVGHGVFVLVEGFGSGLTFPTNGCADNGGNTYTRLVETNGGNIACAIYACFAATSSATTITVTPSTSGFLVGGAEEWDPAGATFSLDQTATNADEDSVTNPTTGTTAATDTANEILLAVLALVGSQTSIAAAANWTEVFEELTLDANPGEGDSRLISATGTQSHTWTISSASGYRAAIATVRATSGGSASVSPSASASASVSPSAIVSPSSSASRSLSPSASASRSVSPSASASAS
ncbi:MAG TPA: hypothetical protein VFK20_11610, partial [Vicinamibacterales bacterium]|nr:hypothetical protein [Vicinamibacterales bacterium]